MVVRARILGLTLIVGLIGVAAWGQPVVRNEPSGHTVLGYPLVLKDEEVERHLKSGLTTTIAIVVEDERKELIGGVQIDVRYELWDEVFKISLLDSYGRGSTFMLDSEDALETWWGELAVPVDTQDSTPLSKLRVKLTIIPFSRSEQAEVQRWYNDAVHRGGRSRGSREGALGGGDALDHVFGVLIATSIQRRPLKTYLWEIDVPRGDPTP